MSAGDAVNGDVRITNALLQHELKQINVKVTEILDIQRKQSDSLAVVVTGLAVACSERERLSERIKTNKEEVDTLRKSNSIWSGINSLISVIAAAFAAAFGLGK